MSAVAAAGGKDEKDEKGDKADAGKSRAEKGQESELQHTVQHILGIWAKSKFYQRRCCISEKFLAKVTLFLIALGLLAYGGLQVAAMVPLHFTCFLRIACRVGWFRGSTLAQHSE